MKVERNFVSKPIPTLALGDVIESNDSFYLIISYPHSQGKTQFVAKDIRGWGGLFGAYDSIDELNQEFKKRKIYETASVYKVSEYKLQLARR